MILAQLTANQIPYDQLDWLQIAIYFLALPIVAFLGAALGLLGRWRRGGMLWSMNVGLLGGAVALLLFALGIWSLQTGAGAFSHLRYFTEHYRWSMLLLTLAGTAGCALVAALAWRLLNKPKEERPLAFSLKQLLIVQGFAMVTLGIWVGLRLFMLQSVGDARLMQSELTPLGWRLDDDGTNISLEKENEHAFKPHVMARIVKIANLKSIFLFHDGDHPNNLQPLLHHPSARTIWITCRKPRNELLDRLASSKMKHIVLAEDLESLDYSRLATSRSLEYVTLVGTLDRKSLESLGEISSLKGLTIRDSKLADSQEPIEAWPPSLESLYIRSVNVRPDDFVSIAKLKRLKYLAIMNFVLAEKDLAFLKSLPPLETATLSIDATTSGWSDPLEGLGNTTLHLELYSPHFSHSDAAHLKHFSKLKKLDLTYTDYDDEIADQIAQVVSLEELTMTSSEMSLEAALRIALLPKLREFYYPAHLASEDFEAKSDEKRRELRLPLLYRKPWVRVPKPLLPAHLQSKQTDSAKKVP